MVAVVVIMVLLASFIPVAFFAGMLMAFNQAREAQERDGRIIKDLKNKNWDQHLQLVQNEVYIGAVKNALSDAHTSLELTLGELLKRDGTSSAPVTIFQQYIHPDKETV